MKYKYETKQGDGPNLEAINKHDFGKNLEI